MSKYGYYLGMTPEQQDIVKMIREFAERELDPVVKEYDEKGEFPVQLHEKWGEMGLFGLDVPEQYGGLGLNAVTRYCISEELAKLLPVRLAAWDHPAFDYRFDAIVYSVSSALGFAAVENILYVLQSDLRTAVSRAILSVPGHFFFAVSMGLLLSRAKQAECCGQLRRRRVLALLALAVPTLLHGLWDFLLAAGSRWAVIAFYAFVAAFFITADVCLRRASRTDSRL